MSRPGTGGWPWSHPGLARKTRDRPILLPASSRASNSALEDVELFRTARLAAAYFASPIANSRRVICVATRLLSVAATLKASAASADPPTAGEPSSWTMTQQPHDSVDGACLGPRAPGARRHLGRLHLLRDHPTSREATVLALADWH